MTKYRKIVFYVLIPVSLLFLGIASALLFNSLSFSTLTYTHSSEDITSGPGEHMIKGDKITIEFTGRENNLGIISVNFEKFNGYNFVEEDRLLFRIKREKEEHWIYENIYGIGGFEKNFNLPFGFPLIADSKDERFVVEIVSTTGARSNSVALSTREPVIQSSYKFYASELKSSPSDLLSFLSKKLILSFTNTSFLYSSIIYFVPLGLYMFFSLFINQKGIVRRILFYLVIPVVIIDSFILSNIDTGLVLIGIGIWIIAVYFYRLESSVSFFFCIVILVVILFVLILGQQDVIEKLAAYLYMLMVVGFVQSVYEFSNSRKKRIGYKDFIKELIKINGKK